MIHILDIHSHKPGEGAIYNLTIEELRVPPPYFNQKQWLSVGLHPWSLTEEWRKDFLHVRKWALLSQVRVGKNLFSQPLMVRAEPCRG